jgi:hypothetical protein
MPREVTDIKSFIEICRRKDARCTSNHTNSPGGKKEERNRKKHGDEMEE